MPPAPFGFSRLLFGGLGGFFVLGGHLTTSGAFWRAILNFGSTSGGHFGISGPPWRTLEAAGWTRGGPEQDFQRFWVDLGTLF